MNARDARWFHRPGRGDSLPLTGRPIKQWDLVHCPPETRHVFVGTGDGPCVILAASSRQSQKDGPWGFYCADETAARYDASSPADTQEGEVAYGRFPPSQPSRYREGLPD
jgi:hypothetical protein